MKFLNGLVLLLALLGFSQSYAGQSTASININTADAKSIAKVLKGVGKKKAAAIVAYRDTHGHFKSAKDLIKVKGIGKKTIQNNEGRITYSMNPCAMKKNPCAMKHNPCAMSHNPCAM